MQSKTNQSTCLNHKVCVSAVFLHSALKFAMTWKSLTMQKTCLKDIHWMFKNRRLSFTILKISDFYLCQSCETKSLNKAFVYWGRTQVKVCQNKVTRAWAHTQASCCTYPQTQQEVLESPSVYINASLRSQGRWM